MKTKWYHYLALAAAIAVIGGFLYLVREILPPFLIAFVIAWLLDPLLDRVQARGVPRVLAVSLVYTVFLAIFVVGLISLIPAVTNQADQLADDIPGYAERFKVFSAGWMEEHRSTLVKLRLPTTLEEAFARYGDPATEKITLGIKRATEWVVSNLSKALWIILIPLIAFYFLTDIDRIRSKAALFIPQRWRPKTTEVLSRMGAVFSSYVRGLVVVCALYGIATIIVLAAFKLKYGVILGLLAGVLYAVPYLGAILTTVLVFIVALATHQHGLVYALWLAAAMVILNQLFDMGVTPRILGRSVGLHPVLSLFALLAGAQLFGLVGMVLAVPVAASIQEVVFEFYPELRPEPKPKKPRRPKKPRAEKKAAENQKSEQT